MKVKLISAIITLLIVVPIILIGGNLYAIVVSLIGVLAYKEVLSLKKSHKKVPIIVQVLGLVSLVYLMLGNYGNNILTFRQILIPLVLMLMPLIFYKKDHYTNETAFYLLGFIYLLGMGFNSFIIIRKISLELLFYVISISIFTDTFACVIGCLIGKHKMCPKISPAKSYEGAIAGLGGGTLVGLIVYSNLIGNISAKVIIVTIILSIVAQLGDLIFSKIKRENSIKDYSNLIPGHGGIIDRFDSTLLVVIVYIIIMFNI